MLQMDSGPVGSGIALRNMLNSLEKCMFGACAIFRSANPTRKKVSKSIGNTAVPDTETPRRPHARNSVKPCRILTFLRARSGAASQKLKKCYELCFKRMLQMKNTETRFANDVEIIGKRLVL